MSGSCYVNGKYAKKICNLNLKPNKTYTIKLQINFAHGSIKIFVDGVNKGHLARKCDELKQGEYVFTL